MLPEHLTQAERHVTEGDRVLKHQRSVIEDLRRSGHNELFIDAAESSSDPSKKFRACTWQTWTGCAGSSRCLG